MAYSQADIARLRREQGIPEDPRELAEYARARGLNVQGTVSYAGFIREPIYRELVLRNLEAQGVNTGSTPEERYAAEQREIGQTFIKRAQGNLAVAKEQKASYDEQRHIESERVLASERDAIAQGAVRRDVTEKDGYYELNYFGVEQPTRIGVSFDYSSSGFVNPFFDMKQQQGPTRMDINREVPSQTTFSRKPMGKEAERIKFEQIDANRKAIMEEYESQSPQEKQLRQFEDYLGSVERVAGKQADDYGLGGFVAMQAVQGGVGVVKGFFGVPRFAKEIVVGNGVNAFAESIVDFPEQAYTSITTGRGTELVGTLIGSDLALRAMGPTAGKSLGKVARETPKNVKTVLEISARGAKEVGTDFVYGKRTFTLENPDFFSMEGFTPSETKLETFNAQNILKESQIYSAKDELGVSRSSYRESLIAEVENIEKSAGTGQEMVRGKQRGTFREDLIYEVENIEREASKRKQTSSKTGTDISNLDNFLESQISARNAEKLSLERANLKAQLLDDFMPFEENIRKTKINQNLRQRGLIPEEMRVNPPRARPRSGGLMGLIDDPQFIGIGAGGLARYAEESRSIYRPREPISEFSNPYDFVEKIRPRESKIIFDPKIRGYDVRGIAFIDRRSRNIEDEMKDFKKIIDSRGKNEYDDEYRFLYKSRSKTNSKKDDDYRFLFDSATRVTGKTRTRTREDTDLLRPPFDSTRTPKKPKEEEPEVPFLPPVDDVFDQFGMPKRRFRKISRRKYGYAPSLTAEFFGIKSSKIPNYAGGFTGAEIRPIIEQRRRRRK